MVDALATILTGAGASVMTEGRDDEEWRKRLTARSTNCAAAGPCVASGHAAIAAGTHIKTQ